MNNPWDAIVVGSGAAGSVTAAMLAAAGARVLVLEDGTNSRQPTNAERFTLSGLTSLYRNGGQRLALGNPLMAFGEGWGAGGSTEVNSGLYHRPPDELLEDWARRFAVAELGAGSLDDQLARIESRLSVGVDPAGPNPAGLLLAQGATLLQWKWQDVPRWCARPISGGERHTATSTYLADAVSAGAVIRLGHRVTRVVTAQGRALGVEARTHGRTVTFQAPVTFLCAGAVNTAGLLLASGVRRNVGTTLKAHPMVKLAAVFEQDVSEADDVASVQVREFAPRITIGASSSSPAVLGSSLARTAAMPGQLIQDWSRMPLYYAAVCPTGSGRVHRAGVVRYSLTDDDMRDLALGVEHATTALLQAGAHHVITAAAGARYTTDPSEAARAVTRRTADLTTVHLTSTAPMGEDPGNSAVDSWGRVHGVAGLWVNDSAALPDAPGVNPQGTVMAFAMRSTERFLKA